jgi:hypothetical protein
MRAQEFTEALDRPYYLHWEYSTDGDVSAVAELPANEGHIHILFEPHRDNKDGSVAWGVEFWRNDSQDITGEGDEFRVFATVLQAVSEFVAKYKPMNLSFQATKKVDQGQKSLSRANLYDKLVQRYARASGYRAFRADAGNNVHYELVKINKGVSEGWKEKVAGAALAAAAVGAFGSAKASPTTGDEFSTPIAGWSTKTDKAGNTTDRYQSGTIDMTATRNAQGQRVHSGGTYQVNKTAAVNVDVPYKDGQKGIATTVGTAANPSDLDHLMSVDAVAKRKGVDPKAFARFQQGSKEQGVPEGDMKDLDIDIQDQQWDAIVGYVVNGVKKGIDTDRMELALYKWASRELVDVEQALEDHGFRDIADLADHIEQHNGRYVPPSDFGLGDLGSKS